MYEGKDGTIEDIITGGPFSFLGPGHGAQLPQPTVHPGFSSYPTPTGPDHGVSLLGHSAEECPFHGPHCQAGLTLLLRCSPP